MKRYKKELDRIKQESPEFINYVNKTDKNLKFSFIVVSSIIFMITVIFLDFFKANPYWIGIFGALVLCFGNIRHTDEIILLSVVNWNYNKRLAKDLILSGLFTYVGTIFIIWSLIITLF